VAVAVAGTMLGSDWPVPDSEGAAELVGSVGTTDGTAPVVADAVAAVVATGSVGETAAALVCAVAEPPAPEPELVVLLAGGSGAAATPRGTSRLNTSESRTAHAVTRPSRVSAT
jgi:hypothetical protein